MRRVVLIKHAHDAFIISDVDINMKHIWISDDHSVLLIIIIIIIISLASAVNDAVIINDAAVVVFKIISHKIHLLFIHD